MRESAYLQAVETPSTARGAVRVCDHGVVDWRGADLRARSAGVGEILLFAGGGGRRVLRAEGPEVEHGGEADRPLDGWGGFGHVGTFSFFFSHHITTIEGGMLVTDDDALANVARSMRTHGWTRDMDDRQEI